MRRKILAVGLIVSLMFGTMMAITGTQGYVTAQDTGTSGMGKPVLEWSFPTTGTLFSAPTLYDLTGDGMAEVIVASEDDHLYCLDPKGNEKWQVPLLYNEFELASILSSPAVADIDGDNAVEIVVGSDDGLAAIDHNGRPQWIYTGSATRYISSPAIADIDGDGVLDIVAGSVGDYMVKRFTSSGDLVWKYATGYGDFDAAVLSSPTLFDLDGNGNMEVLVATHNSVVLALNHSGDMVWHFKTGHVNVASPSVGDVDANGVWDVVSGSDDHSFYSVNTRGEKSWSFETLGPIVSSPAVGDVDGEGLEETVVGSDDGNVYCLDSNGGIKWSYDTGSAVRSSPALADMDGDGKLEVIAGNNAGEVLCLSHTGRLIWSYKTGGSIKYASPTVGDIDNDGYMEVLIGSSDGNLYCLQHTEKSGNVGAMEWPMFKHDNAHTGRYTQPTYFKAHETDIKISDLKYPSHATVGEVWNVTVTVTNSGDMQVGDVEVRLNDRDGNVLASTTIDTLPPEGSARAVLTWYPEKVGEGTGLSVEVDPKGMFNDPQREDNTRSISVSITSPPYHNQNDAGGVEGGGGKSDTSTTALVLLLAILAFGVLVVASAFIMRRRREQ